MTIPETVLTFVGIPAGIIAVITLAVLGPSEMRSSAQKARYRPGRPWTHEPAWFVPRPDADHGGPSAHGELGPAHAAIAAADPGKAAPVGGATGEW